MLVLDRKRGKRIFIGDDVVIMVLGINKQNGACRIGIAAPLSIAVDREEVRKKKLKGKKAI